MKIQCECMKCNRSPVTLFSSVTSWWISLFNLHRFTPTDWSDSSRLSVSVFSCQECLPQYYDRQVHMELSFGDTLNSSINRRGFRRCAERHPVGAFLYLQHLTTGGHVRLLLGILPTHTHWSLLYLIQPSRRWDWPYKIDETILRKYWKCGTSICFRPFYVIIYSSYETKIGQWSFYCFCLF